MFQLIKKHWEIPFLAFFISAYIITFSFLSITRHNAFASNFDLANMDQTIWNTAHGRLFQLNGADGTISRFSIHADLILVLLAPLYWIWDNVRILLIVQSLALGMGAIPVYLLANKIIHERLLSLSIALAYLLNPGMQWANIYDFHGITLAIPFILTAIYAAYTHKWHMYWIFMFLTFLTKEEISLFFVVLGGMLFISKNRIIGILTSAVAATWFIVMVFYVIPHFSPTGGHWALAWFDMKPEFSNKQIITHLTQTNSLQSKFINQDILNNYYLLLLKPFGFLPLLGFPIMALIVPELFINIFSNQGQMQSIFFHYDSGIIPGLVLATIGGFYVIQKITSISLLKKFQNIILFTSMAWVLAWAIRFNYNYSPLPTTPSCWCLIYQIAEADREFEKVLQTIPTTASITSSGNIRPHVTHRLNAFTLPNQVETADYVAILTQERIIGDYEPIDEQFVQQLQQSPEHELISHIDKFYLFKKGNTRI